jgi:hypothetical protein
VENDHGKFFKGAIDGVRMRREKLLELLKKELIANFEMTTRKYRWLDLVRIMKMHY